MSIDDYKDYLELNPEGTGTPKKIIFHDMVGFGVHARDIFICEETTNLKDFIVTGYVVIDERDACYDSIREFGESEHDDILKLYSLGCDYVGPSLYYVVPGSETYCIKDKKVAGVAIIRSYLLEYIAKDKPEDCNVHNWIDFINKDAIYTEVKGIIINAANYLIEQSKNK